MKYLVALFTIILMVGCENDPKVATDNRDDTTNRHEPITNTDGSFKITNPEGDTAATGQNAQKNLDVSGTYKGILPCADCKGIATTLILGKGNMYEISVEYVGKRDKLGSTNQGKYVWNSGNIIILQGVKNAPASYLAEENKITQLNTEGKKMEGPGYVLTKQ